MRDGTNTGMLTSVIVMTALLSACTATSYNQVMSEPIDKVAEQSKLRIDWTTIDSHSDVPKDNSPRDIEYPNITKQMAKASNIPVEDIYRFQTVYDSKEASEVIDKIKAQLGHSYVDLYVNGSGPPKYFIVTRKNVAADTHEYVITDGEARGFRFDIEILPIADRSKEDMLDIYDSEEDIEQIDTIIKKYGGEMQGLGYTPMGFKITIDSYFAKPLTSARHIQMEKELKQLTGVNIEVRRTGRLIF